ncbi:hypothetical protein B0H14DRAFT_3129029, partial [Mycena olivaceomarginata]
MSSVGRVPPNVGTGLHCSYCREISSVWSFVGFCPPEPSARGSFPAVRGAEGQIKGINQQGNSSQRISRCDKPALDLHRDLLGRWYIDVCSGARSPIGISLEPPRKLPSPLTHDAAFWIVRVPVVVLPHPHHNTLRLYFHGGTAVSALPDLAWLSACARSVSQPGVRWPSLTRAVTALLRRAAVTRTQPSVSHLLSRPRRGAVLSSLMRHVACHILSPFDSDSRWGWIAYWVWRWDLAATRSACVITGGSGALHRRAL